MNRISRIPAAPASAIRLPASGEIVRVSLVILAVAGFAALVWRLSGVLAMLFGAILVAIAIRSLGELVSRVTRLGLSFAIVLVCVMLGGAAVAFVYLFGSQMSAQIGGLSVALPQVLDQLGAMVGVRDLGAQVSDRLRSMLEEPGLVEQLMGVTAGLIGIVANALLVVVAGVYLAIRPHLYESGFLLLIPSSYRARFLTAFTASARALKLWLLGQLVSMALVGALTGIGLLVIGVPSPLPLALAAALLEFIPFLGPWLSAVPAVLAALSMGGSAVYWVVGLYLVVQQLENSVITPLVQRQAVDIPPAITLFSLAATTAVLGPIGLLLATPAAVTLMVFVTQLYVRDTLHEAAALPGEHGRSAPGPGNVLKQS
jgi:predicted PurR-regulated permease PerM